MSWFNKLKNKYRVIIAVLSWLPLVVAAGVINSSSGGNADNITDVQAVIALACLAVGVFFTVFAVKARRAEVSAARTEKEKAAAQAKAEAEAKAREERNKIAFPFSTRIVGVTFENRQEYLKQCNQGDKVSVQHRPTFDYPDTLAVVHIKTGNIIGNIDATTARHLLTQFGVGVFFDGHIYDLLGGHGKYKNVGCDIKIDGLGA